MSLFGEFVELNSFNNYLFISKYLKEVNARNVSINAESLISIFPTGDYKLFFYLLDRDKTSQIAVINLGTSVLTSNKDNFG